jgi:hypothetical protein
VPGTASLCRRIDVVKSREIAPPRPGPDLDEDAAPADTDPGVLARKPDVRLDDLLMPGSHDAGMYTFTAAMDPFTQPEWVLTQTGSFARQLAAGSRYFDIRISQYNGQLYTAHWTASFGAWGGHLNQVLEDVVAFMRSPQGMDEVVILKFSHTAKSERALCAPIVKRVKDIVGGARLLHTSQDANVHLATAKLRDLTTPYRTTNGSVVAVFDEEFEDLWNVEQGIFPYHDVPIDGGKTAEPGLWVYDHYANDSSYERLVKDQMGKLAKHGGWGNPYQFLLSWTVSGGARVKDIEVLSNMANPYLPRILYDMKQDGSNRPNVGYVDFLDPYLCRALIAMNG